MIPCLLKLGDRSRFVFVFWKELFFSILVAREIAAKWSRMLVQASSKRQIKRETRPDWLATRIPFLFSYWSPFSPEKCPNCVQMPYPAGTRFDCHKQWIFLYRTVFWGLIKPNCGTSVPKKNSKYTTLSHWVRYFSQTTASICLTPFPHSLREILQL